MHATSIERHAAKLGRATILAATVLTGGCAQIIGVEDLPPLPVDAGSRNFVVRGTATGVLGPVALELRIDGDSELVAVTQGGTFAFDTRLETGASYTVVLVDPGTPCTLHNQTGVIVGTDTDIELICTGASLASVVVSGIAPAVTIVPGTTEYAVDLSLLQQSATLTATAVTAGDTLTIAGTPVGSGMPSAEITLALGGNPVEIVVENGLGWQRTYRLTLRRAAQLAQYAYGKASNTGAGDYFGWSVALSGDTLAVGAPLEDSAATGTGGDPTANSGAVYVFRRSGTSWRQEAYVKASNTEPGDNFGISVVLLGDVLAVGASLEDSAATGINGNETGNAAGDSGAVYVFRRSGTNWQQEAYVKASNTDGSDRFGTSVALSGDTLAVGAPLEDSAATGVGGGQSDNTAPSSGAVYVFRCSGTTWQQEAYVKASNTELGDSFGSSVALSGDTLAVGAPLEDSMAMGVGGTQTDNSIADSGAVYVFRRTGTAWRQEAYVKASNTDLGDRLGSSVALSGDALAVGAPLEDSGSTGVGSSPFNNAAQDTGAVYVFRRSGTIWQQESYIKAGTHNPSDQFGNSVAISGDTLAATAYFEDSAATGVGGSQADNSSLQSGAAYVFRRSGLVWQQAAFLKASNTGADDNFGYSVAVSSDTIAVGAHVEDSATTGVGGDQADNSAMDSGAAYIFH